MAQQWAVGEDIADEGVEAMRVAAATTCCPGRWPTSWATSSSCQAPVTRVAHTDDGVTVTAGGATYEGAGSCSPARSSPCVGGVRAAPARAGAAAIDGLDLGHAAKVTLQYRRRAWEDDPTAPPPGFTVTDEPFGIAWSPTDSYGDPDGPGLLTAFLTGDARRGGRSPDRRRAHRHGAGSSTAVYPAARPTRRAATRTIAWANERYTGGGYAVAAPGPDGAVLAGHPTGTGRIRFAGEHTETLAGYMESAIRSGHRVAKETRRPTR